MARLVQKAAMVMVAGATLFGSLNEASARPFHHGYGRYHHHGIGAGGIAAGVGLGLLGGALAGAAANRYYNGYPAYGYPGYGYRYGYDYHPGYGYYGPY